MSLRNLLTPNILLVVLAINFGLSDSAFASPTTNTSSVQTYTDQAVPVPAPPPDDYYNSPLAAGTLTLEDVLEAHKKPADKVPQLPTIGGTPSATATAPILSPSRSSTSLMMSQGMQEVLQKVNGGTLSTNPSASPTNTRGIQASTPLVPQSTDASGVKYEPGQEPKNLATGGLAPSAAPAPSAIPSSNVPSSAPSSTGETCNQNVQKWEKSCADAGYPATYLGKIVGETRTGCADGALHDVWVTNNCAPPEAASAQTAKTDGVCGVASNNEFDDAPTTNLCAEGIPGAVSGDGPWTWACSGVNGGEAAACAAQRSIPAVNGVCGAANGMTVKAAPASDLCKAGTSTIIKGHGPWTWSCKGIGKGRSESCIAPMASSPATPIAAPVVEETTAPVVAPPPPPPPPPPAPTVAPAPAAPAAATSALKEEEGELCGEAAETLAYQAPQKDLCRSGSPSVVNGDGPWTWSCTNNEGVTSSCRTLSLSGDNNSSKEVTPALPVMAAPKAVPQAPVMAAPLTPSPSSPPSEASPPPPAPTPSPTVELACGPAISHPTQMAPVSGLCQGGKASSVKGSNPWHWTCSKGKEKISCETQAVVDGSCGSANGTALKSAPFAGLCAAGSPSSIQGDGPWTWACNGSGGGVDVSCAASLEKKDDKIEGACGTSDGANLKNAPAEGLCQNGIPSAVSGAGPWTWSCSGSNGGKVDSCSAAKIISPKPPGQTINGLCGGANGVTTDIRPADGLCATGNPTDVVGNGPWNWSCIGENSGMTVSCTAPLNPPAPIDGMCGSANGVTTLILPQSGLCAAGITGVVNGKGPWTWTCSGANGGTPASCIAPLAGRSAATPSVMVSSTDEVVTEAPLSQPSGLVTPRLPASDNIPALDNNVIPSLTYSKPFGEAPSPSSIPSPSTVTGDAAPDTIPSLPEGSEPLQPPSFRDSIPSAPVLQETAAPPPPPIPGNHLTLDPSLSSISFDQGSDNISPKMVPILDQLSNILFANPDVRIALMAYANNNHSSPRDARRLSLQRALAVRTYLAAKDVLESRIDVHAEGANTHTNPVDRVDVKVIE